MVYGRYNELVMGFVDQQTSLGGIILYQALVYFQNCRNMAKIRLTKSVKNDVNKTSTSE